jgi:hypothetical protein
MKKNVLAIAGSALIIFFGPQVAAAAEHHHGKVHQHTYSEYRDVNARAEPLDGPTAEQEWHRYSGGYSDMAGH